MVVTVEVISVVVAICAASITLVGGVGSLMAWGLRRIDARFDKVDARFDKVDARFDRGEHEIDGLRGEVADVRADLTAVKVSVARLEGAQPRLLMPPGY